MRDRVATATSILRTEEHPWLPEGHAPFAGKYTVERILGQGGMGVVFEARHIRLGQRVAIKVLGSALREFPELVQRFEREARACGSLSSAHTVRVFDIDATEDGTPFIVMELLAGRDLGQIIESDGPQPVSRSVRWVIEACDAIAEAHRLGIIHRDLKPSNLFLTTIEGRSLVKVLDFGIAKRVAATEASITQAVCPLGTPQYMSPEQVRCAKNVDVRTDVWSLGVTLYELVTGLTPFPHESSSACIAAIAADPVPDPRTLRPDLPDAFVDVLLRALQKDARNRYQTIEELVSAIAPFANVDEDEETVSAVRRAISSIPSALARDARATLDELASAQGEAALAAPLGNFFAPIASGPSYEVRTFEARAPQDSRSDRTVPPAITPVQTPGKRRRFTSAIAFASAAALGLAGVFLTTQLGATPDAATNALRAPTSLAAPAAAPGSDVVSAAVATPVAPEVATPVAPEEEGPAVGAVVPAQVVLARPTPTPVVPRPLVARQLVSALAAPTADGKPPVAGVTRAKAEKAQAAASRGVHGGLSSPGF